MDLVELRKKLRGYSKEDIIVTPHADLQAFTRQVDVEEVKRNILNPEKLIFAEKQESKKFNESKVDCWFIYSKDLAHRYVLVLNGKIIIVTIIKINRDWQRIIEKK